MPSAVPSTSRSPRAVNQERTPLIAQLASLPTYGVLVLEYPSAPGRGWFWAQAKKLGLTLAYNKSDHKTVILRLK